MPDGAAYFFSDAHLGAAPEVDERERTARLHGFLSSLPGRASSLYIVGDLFDFWFEYGTAIPRRYFPTLALLQRLREAGVDITYLNGNHDFWLGPFLGRTLGIHTHDGALTVERDGRRVWIHHGDGLIGGDLGYRLLKKVIRHPVSIGLYRLLHPDLGIPLALTVSGWSRGSRDARPLDADSLWRQVALPRFAAGDDSVIIGHFHGAIHRREGRREFFVLGDWMRHFTYVVLERGELRMETWTDAGPAPFTAGS